MQSLGLSDATPRSESRLKALLWPSIRHAVDLDYVSEQALWVCCAIGAASLVLNVFAGHLISGFLQFLFFVLAGFGGRQRSHFAAITVFAIYFLSLVASQRLTGRGLGVVSIIFCALLLSNIRATWVAARWQDQQPERTLEISFRPTFMEKFSNELPARIWPAGRWLFAFLAVLNVLGLAYLFLRNAHIDAPR